MKCEFDATRIEPARSAGVKDCPIELSGRPQRAAQMTVALGPMRTNFEQLPVCRGGFLVSLAIAENPGADMGGGLVLGLQFECDAGAFDGVLAPSAMQQGLAEAAKGERQSIPRNFALREVNTAGRDEIGAGAQSQGAVDRRFTNFIKFRHCGVSWGQSRFTKSKN
jgi:hypothetical protein